MTFQNGAIVATDFELRAVDGKRPTFTGYAAVFDSDSDVRLGYRETIAPGAFTRSLKAAKANYTFVLDHDDKRQVASIRAGNLKLGEDSRGLLTEATLPDVTPARDLIGYYEAGMVRGMSFTFKPQNQDTVDGGVRRTVVQLGHVTALVTDDPVYAATGPTVQIRALADTLAADADELDNLFENIREGRALTVEQSTLLDLVAAHYRPTPPEPELPEGRSLDEWKSRLTELGAI